jgi:methionyl-tRNA synthetase
MNDVSETCPCCGYRVGLTAHDICPVCFWEHDPVQLHDPDYAGGANRVSLRQAQQNFIAFGACERRFVEHVDRGSFTRDPDWLPLEDTK